MYDITDDNGEYDGDFDYQTGFKNERDCLDWCANQMERLGWTRYSACEYWEDKEHCRLYGNNFLPITNGDGNPQRVCFRYSKGFNIFQISLLIFIGCV